MECDSSSKEEKLYELRKRFLQLNFEVLLSSNITIEELQQSLAHQSMHTRNNTAPKLIHSTNQLPKQKIIFFIFITFTVLILYITGTPVIDFMFRYALSTRCFIPNNYLVWEATRPVSNCDYCLNRTEAIYLTNVTPDSFQQYAYSAGPIVVRGAVKHWPAMSVFTYDFFKNLYDKTDGSYDFNEDGCQFLHFQSDFITVRDIFTMSRERATNLPGVVPWYVGIGNCHPKILTKMRKYYSKLDFLPEDSEIANREFLFLGYGNGANMHLDYIPRLMWQAQISGNKTWLIGPTPECESKCGKITFYVEPGDAVILDTRVWYHSTYTKPGQFSLTVQSEYG